MDIEELKRQAGYKAATFVEKGMTVGLGTGSTVKYFIEALIIREQQEKLGIGVVSSSIASMELAKKGLLHTLDINQLEHIDLTVDGADEIDIQKRMIKGGGGALLREKILANMSREMVVIVDQTKQVEFLGKRKLPVEIAPFAYLVTLHNIQRCYPKSTLRKQNQEVTSPLYVTDNGNYIVDIHFSAPLENPERVEKELAKIPGVLETGFFFHLAGRVIITYFDGQIVTLP